jgi:hypothetical protein
MSVESQSAGMGNAELHASLDALHRDVYANNMAPYWVVDRSVAHDEDRQVITTWRPTGLSIAASPTTRTVR